MNSQRRARCSSVQMCHCFNRVCQDKERLRRTSIGTKNIPNLNSTPKLFGKLTSSDSLSALPTTLRFPLYAEYSERQEMCITQFAV